MDETVLNILKWLCAMHHECTMREDINRHRTSSTYETLLALSKSINPLLIRIFSIALYHRSPLITLKPINLNMSATVPIPVNIYSSIGGAHQRAFAYTIALWDQGKSCGTHSKYDQ